jgi:hypothetical protein
MKYLIVLLMALMCSGCSGLIALLGANPSRYTAPLIHNHIRVITLVSRTLMGIAYIE